MLWLVGTAERRKRVEPRIHELVEVVDFARLTRELQLQGLLPLVGTRLEQLVPDRLPPSFRDQVRQAVALASRRATLSEAMTLRVAAALEAAGIPAVPLKGPVLAADVYDHPGLRESHDIDVLVPREALDPAVRELERHGWALVPQGGGGALPQLHHVLKHSRPEIPLLELHWRIHWYETGFSSRVVARSSLVPNRARRPTAPDEIAALLLFYCRDGFVGLRYAADLAAWWDADGDALKPNALDPLLADHPELAQALLTSLHVVDTMVGVPLGRLTSLAAPSGVRPGLAERLADWTIHESLGLAGANITLVDWLLCPRGGHRAFLRRNLFPPRPTIRRMYRLADDATFAALLWQAAHPPKLLLRYLAVLWTVRGTRRWTPLPAWQRNGAASLDH